MTLTFKTVYFGMTINSMDLGHSFSSRCLFKNFINEYITCPLYMFQHCETTTGSPRIPHAGTSCPTSPSRDLHHNGIGQACTEIVGNTV